MAMENDDKLLPEAKEFFFGLARGDHNRRMGLLNGFTMGCGYALFVTAVFTRPTMWSNIMLIGPVVILAAVALLMMHNWSKVLNERTRRLEQEMMEQIPKACPCGGSFIEGPRGGLSQNVVCDKCWTEYTRSPMGLDDARPCSDDRLRDVYKMKLAGEEK